MAKQAKRLTRAQKIAASAALRAEEKAERKKLQKAVASLGDRVATLEAARPQPAAPKNPRERDFIGKKAE